ncbi:MAG: hypothetical protein VW600_01860 [Ferrovibrio sp.]
MTEHTAAEQQHLASMAGFIDHAAALATQNIAPETEARIIDLAKRFDAAVAGQPAAPLTVVIYHLSLPEQHRRIDYIDIQADQGAIDYTGVLQHTFAMARGFNPDCRILYVTGMADDTGFVPAGVTVVRLPLDPGGLMYERVVAVNAYLASAAFTGSTAFLDSDAYANAPLEKVFDLTFDVAVTYRDARGLMPLNEGVIFAAKRETGGAQRFFRRYLGTYEALCDSPMVKEVYGNIKRWRGGQLSLNGAAIAIGNISDLDRREIDGALVRYLNCDDYNFFIRDAGQYSKGLLKRKYVLHLKGPSKASVGTAAEFQIPWLAEWRKNGANLFAPILAAQLKAAAPNPKVEAAKSDATPGGYVKPMFAFINKEYNRPPFDSGETRQKFAGHLNVVADIVQANRPGSGAVAVDDMLVWFRNAGFLQQDDFIRAVGSYATDQTLRARIWRIYTLCWAAKSCLGLPGDFMDVGCYDGRTVEIMQRYCGFSRDTQPAKTWFLYDIFDAPPDEARKAGHGPDLFGKVSDTFAAFGNFRVIKGAVPDSFAQGLPDKVAFAQLDLNVAAPELAALEIIHERMVPGGMIVFDDFGFKRYRDSHDAEMAFFRARGEVIFESPTGQGLYIKR